MSARAPRGPSGARRLLHRIAAWWAEATDPSPGLTPGSPEARAVEGDLVWLSVRRARAIVRVFLGLTILATVEFVETAPPRWGWDALLTDVGTHTAWYRVVAVVSLAGYLIADARVRRGSRRARHVAERRLVGAAVWLLLGLAALYAPHMLYSSGLAVSVVLMYILVAVLVHPPGRGAPVAFVGTSVAGAVLCSVLPLLGAPAADPFLQPWSLLPILGAFALLMWQQLRAGLFRALAGRRALRAAHRDLLRAQRRTALAERAAGQAAERARVSRDLHDTVGTGLAGVVAGLEALRLEGDSAGDGAGRALAPVEQAAREALVQLRESVWALGPQALTLGRLGAHVQRLVRLRAATAGLRLTVEVAPGDADVAVEPEAALHLSRIAQEAVANAAAHSGGSAVAVRFASGAEGITLVVADDGLFAGPGDGAGHGLASIRARADALGGTAAVDHGPAGTTVTVRQPPSQNPPSGGVDAGPRTSDVVV